jgi:hypothetical protein
MHTIDPGRSNVTQAVIDTPPPVEVVEYEDYFGFEETKTFTLPDGRQQIFFAVMNEGAKSKFQQKVNRDIHLNRATNDARIKTDPAGERRALIEESVTGWSLMRRNAASGQWEPAPFSKGSPGSELSKWLDKANPNLVEKLEDAIRKANPWLLGEMTVEQIDEEMQRLADLRVQVIEQQEKAAAFPA